MQRMGGVVGHLLYLFFRSGCQPSIVASALAFHPPIPTYSMKALKRKDYSHTTESSADETMEMNTKLEADEDRNESLIKPPSVGTAIPMSFQLIEELPPANYPTVQSYLLFTRQHTYVPIFYFPVPNAKFTLLFSHGNAADIGIMFNTFAFMAKLLNINIVGYDYSGYGASIEMASDNIQPTEKQTYQDILAVYQWLLDTKIIKSPAEELLLYGQSVGSGPTCYLARRKSCCGVILHSPFLSGLRVVTSSRLLACFDIFPNISDLPKSNAPVFIIHGQKDVEVPFQHGEKLYEMLPGKLRYPPWWVPDRQHNDVLMGNEREFIRRMRAFIEYIDNQNKDNVKSSS